MEIDNIEVTVILFRLGSSVPSELFCHVRVIAYSVLLDGAKGKTAVSCHVSHSDSS